MNAHPPKTARGIGWHGPAEALWAAGRQQEALVALLNELNRHGHHKPTPMVLQLVYYMFQRGDWVAAASCLDLQHKADPASDQVLLNLAACLSRAGRTADSVQRAREYLARDADEPLVWDILCSGLFSLGQETEAAEAGTRALMLKDRLSTAAHAASGSSALQLAASPPDTPGLVDVIAFSLWGAEPRYLWGALDNLLAAQTLFPGWQVRISLDNTVPAAWQAAFVDLGATLDQQAPGQALRQRLCWRFLVANDPTVRRFLVRDIDSVLNPRDQAAVWAWLQSGQRFHVMRDWWTHTDLILAGMWGGTAGVLPRMDELLSNYRPRALETPNVDQWFLRDCVWPLLRDDCLVHDRCFHPPGRQPWPLPAPAGNLHVGQNENASRPAEQQQRLQAWISRLPSR